MFTLAEMRFKPGSAEGEGKMNGLLKRFVQLPLVLALLACGSGSASGQEPAAGNHADSEAYFGQGEVQQASVVVDAETLFVVRGTTAYPAEQRAEEIAGRIEALAATSAFATTSLRIEERAGYLDIMAAGQRVMSVYEADAQIERVGRQVPGDDLRHPDSHRDRPVPPGEGAEAPGAQPPLRRRVDGRPGDDRVARPPAISAVAYCARAERQAPSPGRPCQGGPGRRGGATVAGPGASADGDVGRRDAGCAGRLPELRARAIPLDTRARQGPPCVGGPAPANPCLGTRGRPPEPRVSDGVRLRHRVGPAVGPPVLRRGRLWQGDPAGVLPRVGVADLPAGAILRARLGRDRRVPLRSRGRTRWRSRGSPCLWGSSCRSDPRRSSAT